MRSNYANVQVHLSQDEIEVTLTRRGSVPALRGDWPESPEGRSMLRQVHEAMFLFPVNGFFVSESGRWWSA